jgi:hypothetical protein
MTKKIKFSSIEVGIGINHPTPASKNLPQWFKKMAGVIDGIQTIKKCMPVFDSLTSGYIVVLAADVYFDGNEIQQISTNHMVMAHHQSQIEGMPVPPEYKSKPYKWINYFTIKTPRGYSTLFTHPINRMDLPFYTLSGVVETDKFGLTVNFPFFIKKNFKGIIPAGTPIAQLIPFKRDDWKSEVNDTKPVKLPAYRFTMHNPPLGYYKKHFWSRKKYL